VKGVKEGMTGGRRLHTSSEFQLRVRPGYGEGKVNGAQRRVGAGLPGIHVDDFGGIPEIFQFGVRNGFFAIRVGIFSEPFAPGVFLVCCGRGLFWLLTPATFAGVHIDWH